MNDKYFDEPLIVPITPHEALARVIRVLGVLTRDQECASAVSADAIASLEDAQRALTAALAAGAAAEIGAALVASQEALSTLYAQLRGDDVRLQRLGFPTDSQLHDPFALAAPDGKSVIATFTLNGKQVLSSLAFERAPGATAYWLHVVRTWEEDGETQRIEDPILESPVPLFARVRLPIGPQTLRLKARNPSASRLSEEFTITVPDLTQH